MDNFEYSIQINDRDWEEFYSTAEECGLMQVSLATAEEICLSDTEQEDTTHRTLSNKPKFIRISLCPPPQEEHPALQISQPVVSQSVQTSNRWLHPNEDVLSGSEDEEEFGSVTRFLCQKEYMLQKKESEQRIDIPLPKSVDHDISNPGNENSRIHSERESIIEYIRTLNLDRNVQYKVGPIQLHMGKTTMERSTNTEVELGRPAAGPPVSVQPDGNPRPGANLNYPNNSLDCAHKFESCSSVKGDLQEENIPDINRSKGDTIGEMGYSRHETTLSGLLSKDDCVNEEHEMSDGQANLEETPSSKHNGLVHYTMENEALDDSSEVATEASVNSSAVEQNVPTSAIEELHSCISHLDGLNIEVKATSNTSNPVDYTTSIHSLVPVNTITKAWRNQTLTQPSSVYSRETVLTLPEMYDFFFDDVSDAVSLETESIMASRDGIVYTPEMYEYFFLEDEEENRANCKGDNTSQASATDLALASTSSVDATWPEAYEFFFADGPQDDEREGIFFNMLSSQVKNAADIIQSFVPEGLKGFTGRRAHQRRGPDRSLIAQEDHHRTSKMSGSIAPYLSPSRSDVCLVFLAFAFWAVKSSDLQSSDGWKTALLANIGAVSAIQYLRRRSRRTWQESPPEPGDET